MNRLEKYKEYVNAYQSGNPLISDDEFDRFQEKLFQEGVISDKFFGSDNYSDDSEHFFPVLSLDSIKSENDQPALPYRFIQEPVLGVSWKYDGISVNLQYINGNLKKIITRGNKWKGENITQKFWNLVPEKITTNFKKLEIRGELVMKKSVFQKKYSDLYSHPRNLVAGIKNDLNIEDNRVSDLEIVTFDAITPDGTVLPPEEFPPEIPNNISHLFHPDQWNDLFQTLKKKREIFDYPTDGIVIRKISKSKRKHNGNRPEDMIAVKFSSKKTTTYVTHIGFNHKPSGKIIPMVYFKEFIVDGRKIKSASGHNWKNILEKGIGVGAEIEVAIANDIIPYVNNVLVKSETMPTPPDNSYQDGPHLYSREINKSDEIADKLLLLGLENYGFIMLKKVVEELELENWWEVFNSEIFNKNALHFLGPKRSIELAESIANIKELDIITLVLSMKIPNLGWKIAKQISRKLSRLNADYRNLNREPIQEFGNRIQEFKEMLKTIQGYGIKINPEKETNIPAQSIKYIMTGSPKNFGWKTKAEFKKSVPENYIETDKFTDADILFTDDLNSNSGKMQKAKKNNLSIKLYGN